MASIFTTKKQLILASGSPRRQRFLAELGLDFQVICREIDETVLEDEVPEAYVRRLALAKANLVACDFPESVVIGADTSVVWQGEIMGKPLDDIHHLCMLKKLVASSHQVVTGFALVAGKQQQMVEVVTTRVQFGTFSDAILQAYIASGDGRDKAGGYGMQSGGAFLVAEITGSHANVIGLPMAELVRELLVCSAIAPRCTS